MSLTSGMVETEKTGGKVSMQRRQYPEDFKQRIVNEAIETGNCNVVARRHDVASTIVSRWVRESKMPQMKKRSIDPEVKRLIADNEKLKRLVGEKELEINVLRDLVKKGNRPWKKE